MQILKLWITWIAHTTKYLRLENMMEIYVSTYTKSQEIEKSSFF